MSATRLDLRNLPKVHNEAEVEQAAAELTPVDLKRLLVTARAIFTSLELETAARDADDLVSEALTRTLNRSRCWRQGVDFVYHLVQSMRSIAWTWREQEDAQKAAAAGPLPEPPRLAPKDAEMTSGRLESVLARAAGAETTTIARDLVRQIFLSFAEDRTATAVLNGWALGCRSPEIRRRYGMTDKELQAAVRRIRRFAQAEAQP